MKKLACLTCALFAACGDDNRMELPDASMPDPDAPPDTPQTFVPPMPFHIPLSAAGPDQLQAAVPGPLVDTFYAAGFATPTVNGVRNVIVVKLTIAGPEAVLDTSFGGGDGIATTAIEFRGGSDEIDLVVQQSGKLVVSATVANAANPNDHDVALLRLDADGNLDTTFGDAGLRVLDLNTAHDNNGTLVGLDASRGLAVDATGALYLHAIQRGEGLITGGTTPRTDTDLAVVKLTADGTVDLAFGGGDGKHLLDIFAQNMHSSATARGIHVLPNGSILATGYASTAAVGNTVQAVLYKLTTAGELDTTFAEQGLFHDVVLATQTEIYNVAIHGNDIVTAGYGRNTGTANDWVSMRFDATTGARDTAWGGAPNGAVLVDPSGTMLGSNCRNAIGLPGGKTVLIGSTGPGNMPAQDAAFVVLDATGRLDPKFGAKAHTYQLGANGNDQFWGGVAANGRALLVGYKGGGSM
jgi:uncharacterized delta-60 repeat protein